jgi:hypothetical protein
LPIAISLAVQSNEAAVTERSSQFQRSPARDYLLDLLANKGKSKDAH